MGKLETSESRVMAIVNGVLVKHASLRHSGIMGKQKEERWLLVGSAAC